MASNPGILTHWPWQSLGSFKYLLLAPLAHSTYSYFMVKGGKEKHMPTFHIFPFILFRFLHHKIWIYISRRRTSAPANRIVDKPIDDHQLRRESNWDDQILMIGLMIYIPAATIFREPVSKFPIWRADGVVLAALLHAGPVEFLYYWLHRALHHHFLYSRYHSHHHSSIVTQPITSVIHPFVETMSYITLFAIPELALVFTRTGSLAALYGYIFYIDFMNNMGHCNFHSPFDYFDRSTSVNGTTSSSLFSPLKLLMYTPSYHSVHHTKFRKNYSLFMPFYDYIYETMDTETETEKESP